MTEQETIKLQKRIQRKIVLVAVVLLLGIVSIFGTTYAIFSRSLPGEKGVVIHAKKGSFDLTFYDGENISLQNVSTMSLEEASATKPYHFTIANNGVADAYYRVSLVEDGAISNQISKEYLGYSLEGSDGTDLTGTLDELGSSMEVIRDKRLSTNNSVDYDLRIWLTEDAPNTEMGKTYQSKVGISSTQAISTFADYLIQKANQEGTTYQKGNQQELYTFNEEATNDTTRLISYRYLGNNPNNYVLFNNELWRIIGIFQPNEYGYNPQVKLIKEDGLSGAYGTNSNAPSLLTTSAYYARFNDESRKMAVYTPFFVSQLSTLDLNGDRIYEKEHNQKTTTISSLVGLPMLSDYVGTYKNGYHTNCYNDISSCTTPSWMTKNQMAFLNRIPNSDYEVYTTEASGKVVKTSVSTSLLNRPVVYLNTMTYYVSGNGTSTNPYRITI